jgi:HD superfamily phosphohydrolase
MVSFRASARNVQDPVHGTMAFTGLSTIVVDLLGTPELSRLRHIKQLGLASFVFPGADHSRFQHSVGAAYTAKRFVEHLRSSGIDTTAEVLLPDESIVRDAAVAGLLHDLGHGPFSHVWEKHVIGDHFDRANWVCSLGLDFLNIDWNTKKWHEIVSLGLINWEDGALYERLSREEQGFPQRISRLLCGNGWPAYISPLLDGDVDVDRMDFLLRDSLFAGVTYGRIDIERLIECSRITHTPNSSGGRRRLALAFNERRGLNAIEQLLVGRRAMYRSVYLHKTVRAGEIHLGRVLHRLGVAVAEKRFTPRDPVLERALGGEALRQDEILRLTDGAVWALLVEVEEAIHELDKEDRDLTDLMTRFRSRNWLKLIAAGPRVAALRDQEDHGTQISAAIRSVIPEVSGMNHFVFDRCEYPGLLGRHRDDVFLERDGGELISLAASGLFSSRAEEVVRLYAPAEAMHAVRSLL